MIFLKKLELVLEVFDKSFSRDYVQGVKKTQVRKTFFYEFTDPDLDESPSYTVTIVKTFKCEDVIARLDSQGPTKESSRIRVLLGQAEKLNEVEDGLILTDYVYSVSLTADDHHSSTGRFNWTFVYGKMLECLIDFMDHEGTPALITFTGAEPSMAPVYARFIKLMDKNIGVRYRKLTDDMSFPFYVLDDIVKALSASGSDDISDLVGDVESKYAEELKSDKLRRQRGF
jgi:hypothetical protein